MQGYIVAVEIGICVIMMIFTFITNSLSRERKRILFGMVLGSMFIILAELVARLYNGNTSSIGHYITRISKFLHYELNLLNIWIFALYVKNMLKTEGGITKTPKSLIVNDLVLLAGGLAVIFSQFTGLYYYYDAANMYQRARFYGVSYVFSSIAIVILAANIIAHRKIFSKKLFVPFLMFTLAPLVASIAHFALRGVSMIGFTIVAMTVLLYCFSILDANEAMDKSREKEMENIRLMLSQTASALAEAIDAKDPYTSGHSRRVAEYSAMIAKKFGKSEEYCKEIYLIGLMHDVGKIGIPGSIINKTGKLTDEEYAIMKTHPVKGEEILSKISLSPNFSIGAHYHHERYDGKGYPEGLKGDEIPEIARIIAVADTYDAMTSKRSYRDGLPKEKVRQELLNGMNTQFDARFAAIMIQLMNEGAA